VFRVCYNTRFTDVILTAKPPHVMLNVQQNIELTQYNYIIIWNRYLKNVHKPYITKLFWSTVDMKKCRRQCPSACKLCLFFFHTIIILRSKPSCTHVVTPRTPPSCNAHTRHQMRVILYTHHSCTPLHRLALEWKNLHTYNIV